MRRILAVILLIFLSACAQRSDTEVPIDGGLGGTGIEVQRSVS
ncbi:hypothetical protein AADZ90_006470 [Aestuariibius sp. 2305UL40-4]